MYETQEEAKGWWESRVSILQSLSCCILRSEEDEGNRYYIIEFQDPGGERFVEYFCWGGGNGTSDNA